MKREHLLLKDDAELFTDLTLADSFFRLIGLKDKVSLSVYTYPKVVPAQINKIKLQVNNNEIASFFETGENGNIDVSFSFGRNFKSS